MITFNSLSNFDFLKIHFKRICKDKYVFYGLEKIFKFMLNKYRISNIFPDYILS